MPFRNGRIVGIASLCKLYICGKVLLFQPRRYALNLRGRNKIRIVECIANIGAVCRSRTTCVREARRKEVGIGRSGGLSRFPAQIVECSRAEHGIHVIRVDNVLSGICLLEFRNQAIRVFSIGFFQNRPALFRREALLVFALRHHEELTENGAHHCWNSPVIRRESNFQGITQIPVIGNRRPADTLALFRQFFCRFIDRFDEFGCWSLFQKRNVVRTGDQFLQDGKPKIMS